MQGLKTASNNNQLQLLNLRTWYLSSMYVSSLTTFMYILSKFKIKVRTLLGRKWSSDKVKLTSGRELANDQNRFFWEEKNRYRKFRA